MVETIELEVSTSRRCQRIPRPEERVWSHYRKCLIERFLTRCSFDLHKKTDRQTFYSLDPPHTRAIKSQRQLSIDIQKNETPLADTLPER